MRHPIVEATQRRRDAGKPVSSIAMPTHRRSVSGRVPAWLRRVPRRRCWRTGALGPRFSNARSPMCASISVVSRALPIINQHPPSWASSTSLPSPSWPGLPMPRRRSDLIDTQRLPRPESFNVFLTRSRATAVQIIQRSRQVNSRQDEYRPRASGTSRCRMGCVTRRVKLASCGNIIEQLVWLRVRT